MNQAVTKWNRYCVKIRFLDGLTTGNQVKCAITQELSIYQKEKYYFCYTLMQFSTHLEFATSTKTDLDWKKCILKDTRLGKNC